MDLRLKLQQWMIYSRHTSTTPSPVHAPRIVHTSVDVDTIPSKYQRLPKEPRFFLLFSHDNFYKLLRQRYELQSVLPNFGEGVDRMYRELEEGGWPNPVFKQDDFMLRASLVANQSGSETSPDVPNDPNPIQMHLTGQILSIIESNPSVSRRKLAERLGISERRTRDILKEMQDTGRLKRVGSTRGIWIIVK